MMMIGFAAFGYIAIGSGRRSRSLRWPDRFPINKAKSRLRAAFLLSGHERGRATFHQRFNSALLMTPRGATISKTGNSVG
jgi:hypothetical protein